MATLVPNLSPAQQSKYLKFAKMATKILLVILVAGIAKGFTQHGDSQASQNTGTVLTVVVVGGLFLVWVPVLCYWAAKITSDGIDSAVAATQPIPTPAEIGWQLSQEWGRVATVEEVAAVQQMLINQKNQHLINAGMSLGAIYLLTRNGHG